MKSLINLINDEEDTIVIFQTQPTGENDRAEEIFFSVFTALHFHQTDQWPNKLECYFTLG
jgi:hypothetical protein